jgi:ribose transport system substrate-binding protein
MKKITKSTKGRAVLITALSLSLVVAGTTSASASKKGSCVVSGAAFSTDEAKGGVNFSTLKSSLGAVPKPAKGLKMGSLMKFLGNQYWIDLAAGQKTRAKKYGVTIDVQAAASESDQVGQLNAMQTMVTKG